MVAHGMGSSRTWCCSTTNVWTRVSTVHHLLIQVKASSLGSLQKLEFVAGTVELRGGTSLGHYPWFPGTQRSVTPSPPLADWVTLSLLPCDPAVMPAMGGSLQQAVWTSSLQ